jgi:hypothetical protein
MASFIHLHAQAYAARGIPGCYGIRNTLFKFRAISYTTPPPNPFQMSLSADNVVLLAAVLKKQTKYPRCVVRLLLVLMRLLSVVQ